MSDVDELQLSTSSPVDVQDIIIKCYSNTGSPNFLARVLFLATVCPGLVDLLCVPWLKTGRKGWMAVGLP